MARTITEQKRYKREELEAIAGFAAKAEIIGGMYVGDFGEQTFEWLEDGSLVIVTAHQPAEPGEWKRQAVSDFVKSSNINLEAAIRILGVERDDNYDMLRRVVNYAGNLSEKAFSELPDDLQTWLNSETLKVKNAIKARQAK